MRSRDKLMEELTQEDLDKLLASVDEADFRVDDEITERIRQKTLQQIRPAAANGSVTVLRPLRRLAAAVFVIAALSLLSPQVQATVRRLVSLIPGIGMVETETSQNLLARDIKVTKGEALILGSPVIRTASGGIQLTLQIRESTNPQKDDRLNHLQDFTASINGVALKAEPMGVVSGGEDQSVYQVFFEAAPQAGDRIAFASDRLGIEVTGTLEDLESQDPLTMAHVRVKDILLLADPVKSATGWDLYVHALSDKVRPISFVDSYEFDPALVFETAAGQKIPVIAPESYGTGFMPPLKLTTEAQTGDLVIPSVTWSTADTAKYSFTLPEAGEVIRPDNGFTLAGFPVRVETISRQEANPDEIRLEMTWSNDQLSLDFFSVDGPSAMTLDNGKVILTLDAAWTLLGRQTIHFDSPELTWHEELRIPLDLTQPD